MSSSIDYIFVKSLDKCVVIIISIPSSSKISIEFLMRNTTLCSRWFVLSSTTLLPFVQQKLVRALWYTLRSLLSSNCSSLPWRITIFYVRNVVRISPPLENSWYKWYFTITILFLVPVLFLTGIPTDGLVILKTSSNLIALKLMVNISFLDYWLSNRHSNIVCAT